jgi:hypothetical protein
MACPKCKQFQQNQIVTYLRLSPGHGIDRMSARTESTALDWLVANGWQVTHVTVGAGDT